MTTMGRPRAFTEHVVLNQAMQVFWSHGYAGTSIQNLVDATGVNRASLYATFGDKEQLFLAALDHYVAEVSAARVARLRNAASAREGLTSYFEGLVAFGLGEGRGLGCLLTNSVVELAPHDPDVAARLKTTLQRVEGVFEETIRRGQAAGEFPLDRDPKTLAQFLLTVVQGLRVLMRAHADEHELRAVVKTALSAVGYDAVCPSAVRGDPAGARVRPGQRLPGAG